MFPLSLRMQIAPSVALGFNVTCVASQFLLKIRMMISIFAVKKFKFSNAKMLLSVCEFQMADRFLRKERSLGEENDAEVEGSGGEPEGSHKQGKINYKD